MQSRSKTVNGRWTSLSETLKNRTPTDCSRKGKWTWLTISSPASSGDPMTLVTLFNFHLLEGRLTSVKCRSTVFQVSCVDSKTITRVFIEFWNSDKCGEAEQPINGRIDYDVEMFGPNRKEGAACRCHSGYEVSSSASTGRLCDLGTWQQEQCICKWLRWTQK